MSVGSIPGSPEKRRDSRRTPAHSAPLTPPPPLWKSKRLRLAALGVATAAALATIVVAMLPDYREARDDRAGDGTRASLPVGTAAGNTSLERAAETNEARGPQRDPASAAHLASTTAIRPPSEPGAADQPLPAAAGLAAGLEQPPAAAVAAASAAAAPDAGDVRPQITASAAPAAPSTASSTAPPAPGGALAPTGAATAAATETRRGSGTPARAAEGATHAATHPAASTPIGNAADGQRPSPSTDAPRKPDRNDGALAQAPRGADPDGGAARAEPKAAAGSESPRRASATQRPPPDDETRMKRVVRFAASGGAVLKGRAIDADTGKPIAGAIIDARLGDTFVEVETDAGGAFRIPGMLPGARMTVWVVGRADIYVAESMSVAIPGEGETADTGVIRLIHGNETAARLQGWVGLFVTHRGRNNVVSAISPWLSADRAGIEVGDVLLSVDGHDVRTLGPRATSFLLRGPTGTKASIVAQDSQGALRNVELERIMR